MIFLTVGSWRKGFDRLIKAVDELVENGFIKEPVIAQIGHSSYVPKNMKTMEFCSPDDFSELISQARMIIAHAGIGTIAMAVRKQKPVVVVPRKSSLGEHFDDHQFATAKALEKEGKILVAYEVEQLEEKARQAENFVPEKTRPSNQILSAVQQFIDNFKAEKTHRKKMTD